MSQESPTFLEVAKKGYFPTWSHLQQWIKGFGVYGTTSMVMYANGCKLSKGCELNAHYMVNTFPGHFKESEQVIKLDVWSVHPQAGTTFIYNLWATRKGGFFKKNSLPANELQREVFLVRHLKEIENAN